MLNIIMQFFYLTVLATLCGCDGARILGISPSPFLSHQLPFQAVMKALAARGHQVTFISPNPQKTPVENLTDIDVSVVYKYWKTSMDFSEMHDTKPLDTADDFLEAYRQVAEIQLSSPQVQSLIKTQNLTFDVVIMEKLILTVYYGLVHHVGSPPVIGFLSFTGTTPCYYDYGNPQNPAFVPEIVSPTTDHMSFWERLFNFYAQARTLLFWNHILAPQQEAMMRKYFGPDPPSIYESQYNDSLLLTSHHWILNYPRPMLPNVVELTGLHIQKTTKPLPKDIQSFLDGAEHGVIYFSLGSNVMGSGMPKKKRDLFVEAFSKLPQRVLWKWEEDTLPGKPDNIMTRKWFSQQDVLAHPNVRLFISQCGVQSFQEAVYYGVPIIGMPFLGDQWYNLAKIEHLRIGTRLVFNDLTKEILVDTVRTFFNDSSYQDNMKSFSELYREQQVTSLDRAVWWVEYVLRHNGAHHLRSAALDLTWYQYLLVDVIGFIILFILLVLVIAYFILKKMFSIFKDHIFVVKLKKM